MLAHKPLTHAEWVKKWSVADPVATMLQSLPRVAMKSPPRIVMTARPATTDPDATFRAEFAADQSIYLRAGITEDDYITSRRISAHVEPLVAFSSDQDGESAPLPASQDDDAEEQKLMAELRQQVNEARGLGYLAR